MRNNESAKVRDSETTKGRCETTKGRCETTKGDAKLRKYKSTKLQKGDVKERDFKQRECEIWPFLSLMLLTFTTGRMVRSVHPALSPIRFTVQFDFAVSDIYSYEKIHTAALRTADGLISALVTI